MQGSQNSCAFMDPFNQRYPWNFIKSSLDGWVKSGGVRQREPAGRVSTRVCSSTDGVPGRNWCVCLEDQERFIMHLLNRSMATVNFHFLKAIWSSEPRNCFRAWESRSCLCSKSKAVLPLFHHGDAITWKYLLWPKRLELLLNPTARINNLP